MADHSDEQIHCHWILRISFGPAHQSGSIRNGLGPLLNNRFIALFRGLGLAQRLDVLVVVLRVLADHLACFFPELSIVVFDITACADFSRRTQEKAPTEDDETSHRPSPGAAVPEVAIVEHPIGQQWLVHRSPQTRSKLQTVTDSSLAGQHPCDKSKRSALG